MKNNFYKAKRVVRRVALFEIFVPLFKVKLSRKQLDSHACFCSQSAVIITGHMVSGNSTLHS